MISFFRVFFFVYIIFFQLLIFSSVSLGKNIIWIIILKQIVILFFIFLCLCLPEERSLLINLYDMDVTEWNVSFHFFILKSISVPPSLLLKIHWVTTIHLYSFLEYSCPCCFNIYLYIPAFSLLLLSRMISILSPLSKVLTMLIHFEVCRKLIWTLTVECS